MSGLLLPLVGPMQSWADTGFGQLREAGPFPSRAAVLGIVAAALGVPRADARLVALHDAFRVHVATVRPGQVRRDFHTVETDPRANKTITWRDYHHDARFAALLEADDPALVDEAAEALRRPVYPAFLGRRSCPPTWPLLPADGAPTLAGLAEYAGRVGEGRGPAAPVLYLDGHVTAPPAPFERSAVTHGTRRDRLVGRHRAYVNRPFTRLVVRLPDPHLDHFDAAPESAPPAA